MYQQPTKMWKEKPPGEEQLLLEEMFENGSITAYATPEAVRQSSETFKAFSSRIFGAHFRKTKAKMGEFLSLARGIPNGVIHTWQYSDHDAKTDYVCVAINIFTGSKSTNFDITEDGSKIIVRFAWPTAMYRAAEMFAEELQDKAISKQHPMLHAMSSSLLDTGVTENSKVDGQWIINLPCKVRRELSSYTMSKIQSGTTKIMFLRFTAYQNDAIIEQANRTLTFD